MTASLTASFILKLEDQLSNGLAKLSRQLETLARLGRQVKLQGLETADRTLDKLGTAAGKAADRVSNIGKVARASEADLKRLSIDINGAGVAVVPPGLTRLRRDAAALDGLTPADRLLNELGAAAGKASDKVSGIGRQARAAEAELKRLSIYVNGAGTAFIPPSLARARAAEMAAAMGAAGAGGGGGFRLPPPSVPFMSPSPSALPAPPVLRLAAPGAAPSGIPIPAFNARTRASLNFGGAFEQMASGASMARGQMARLGGQVQAVNHHMRELGEGALVAAGTGFGLMEPIREFAKYENTARHIAITAGTSLADIPRVTGELMKQYNATALAAGQSSDKVIEAAQFLITTGIGRENVDKLLPLVARASTAYNTPIGDSVQAIFSLKEQLHVKDADLAGTISAAAQAGKEGHFSFADLSRYIPNLATEAYQAKLQGGAGARDLFALLETSRRNAGTSGEAATNLSSFLGHLFGDSKRGLGAAFRRKGVDLQGLELNAEKKGISLPEAVIEQVRSMTTGMTDVQKGNLVGSLFHEKESRLFVLGALNDLEYLQRLRAKLRQTDAGTIDNDFEKAAGAPQVKLQLLQEKLIQIERRVGEGFAVLLDPFNAALDHVLSGLDRIDATYNRIFGKKKGPDLNPMGPEHSHPVEEMPTSITTTLLGYVGGLLATAGVMGLLVPLFKLMRSGFMLLATPVRWLVTALAFLARTFTALLMPAMEGVMGLAAALGAPFEIGGAAVLAIVALIAGAAYLIYENWGAVVGWFRALWDDVLLLFRGFYDILAGVFTGDMGRVVAGVKEVWASIIGYYYLIWEAVRGIFGGFISFVDSWTGGAATRVINGIKSAWGELTGFFGRLVAGWRTPFDDFITSIETRIAHLRGEMGLGPRTPSPDRANPDGGVPGLPQPAVVIPGAYRPGNARGEPTPIPVNVNIRVDQDGRVVGATAASPSPQARTNVDRGDVSVRA